MSGTEVPQERSQTNEPEPQPESADTPADAAVRKPGRRGRVAAAAGGLLLVGALIAGVSATVVTVRGADRDAGAPRWKFPKATAEDKKAPAPTGLAGMLVPYGTDGWVRGPDYAEFGSDAQLSGAQATALRKESLRGLSRSARKELEKEIDRQRPKGIAMRSYFSGDAKPYLHNEEIYTVSIVLTQMENRAAVRDVSEFQRELLGALGARKGPKIKGHKDAECFRAPEGSEEDLTAMFCSAHVGDVLVMASAYGTDKLDSAGVATLLRTQLDRIAEPGKAI
ncbi:hypothetical protein SSP24_68890 [Streptomyces spinoverrucosus]|uniref:Secreted protein n=1 Tax=Streptomyces spinoverrucosus TaxID=284043 RepID=A0A4Y3VQK0_9ACTN|nr:hypothetical protein [Streptomyces spinoverrucosus]GEC09234.1 hypothetical protein SSP24_68890 [Streptomyces spinoverrucosus]GHB52713.1 hypothetical protein GCM10010397_23300 [Streptomyces spinoverrucosus]